MSLPVNYESNEYKFYKTLNEDVEIKPISPTAQHWDIQMENGDYVNVAGLESLKNAIIIAIMTRFNEISDIPLYDKFGCRIHDLVKSTFTEMVGYEMEVFIKETLEKIRRIKEVHNVEIIETGEFYKISFGVTAINEEIVTGSVII